jgi:Ni,Fe-hydrogenase III small subunit/formate hydrogenlyase subunit 6/NADH:ubiquinone oxidoreductase subunit I
LTKQPCVGTECNACATACPTDAIKITDAVSTAKNSGGKVALDLGACIGCQLCIDVCPTGTIVPDRSTTIARKMRADLVLHSDKPKSVSSSKKYTDLPSTTQQLAVLFPNNKAVNPAENDNLFKKSLHARVVSTGCSACDMEIGACSNPVFDLERFGVHIVASPRFADALLVTGPVGKGMRDALLRCYDAMPDPKIVVAVGTCAISGGVHKNGYAEANGVDKFLPIAVYIPGCPPHPWSIIHGILLAMGRVDT